MTAYTHPRQKPILDPRPLPPSARPSPPVAHRFGPAVHPRPPFPAIDELAVNPSSSIPACCPAPEYVHLGNNADLRLEACGVELMLAQNLNNIGWVHYQSREFRDALDAFLSARQIRLDKFGRGHVDTAKSCNNCGLAYLAALGDAANARAMYGEAQQVFEEYLHFGTDNPNVHISRVGLARALVQEGDGTIQYYTPQSLPTKSSNFYALHGTRQCRWSMHAK